MLKAAFIEIIVMTIYLKKMHYLNARGDFRIQGLEEMFKGFNNALDNFEQKFKENQWYDADFYNDEIELIYGVVFVSLQNYINGWCSDFRKNELYEFTNNYEYYSKNTTIISDDISQIRLIVDLANYFKHKDEKGDLYKITKECLNKLDLLKFRSNYKNGYIESLIYEGILLLCPGEFNINGLLTIVKEWRDKSVADL